MIVFKVLRSIPELIVSMLDVKAAELRTGMSAFVAIDAVVQLANVRRWVGDKVSADEVLDMAVLMIKCGLRPDDIDPMMRTYWRMKSYGAPVDAESYSELLGWLNDNGFRIPYDDES